MLLITGDRGRRYGLAAHLPRTHSLALRARTSTHLRIAWLANVKTVLEKRTLKYNKIHLPKNVDRMKHVPIKEGAVGKFQKYMVKIWSSKDQITAAMWESLSPTLPCEQESIAS